MAAYEQFRQTDSPQFFFQNFSNQFRAKGQLIIHLWDDIARNKPDVVASRLRALAGESVRIPARLTQARRIEKHGNGLFTTEPLTSGNRIEIQVSLWLPLVSGSVLKRPLPWACRCAGPASCEQEYVPILPPEEEIGMPLHRVYYRRYSTINE